MEDNQITNLLTIFLAIFGVILFTLIIVYVVLLMKSKKKDKKVESKDQLNKNSTNPKEKDDTITESLTNIDKFIEFEKIEDNMIIQKERQKYIMVVECQGINYDLMSGVEKNAVEQGFLQFLNSLRHPIQIYIQTRTVNLEDSINTYRKKVNQIEEELYKREQEYELIMEDVMASKEDKQRALFAVTKQRNLYEYGVDVISDTEKMSKNSNILNKNYYIVIPFYVSDLGENDYSEYNAYEIRNIAFSELYTRSQAIIRTLTACDVKGKILNSKELVELLYIAYNREHEENYSFDRALKAQYDKLYTTAEDVYRKRIKELDRQIEERAVQKARENIDIARSELEQQAREKSDRMDELINGLAKIILEENKEYLGEEIVDKATENIEKEIIEKKEVKNEKKEKSRRNSTRKE